MTNDVPSFVMVTQSHATACRTPSKKPTPGCADKNQAGDMHSMTSVIAKAVFNPETCDVAQKQGTLTVTGVFSVLCLPEGTCAMSGAGAGGGG